MRRWRLVLLIAALPPLAGCSVTGGVDTCAAIDGKTFVSVNQMECGPSPDAGVTLCNWHITFTGGTYSWSHSDVVETGSYSCDGPVINATRGIPAATPLLGRLDAQTAQLTWDGQTYLVQ